MKKLVPKSINDTLKEIKLAKYEGNIKYFANITDNDVIDNLLNEWDNIKLNDWKGPSSLNENDKIEYEIYEKEGFNFADSNKCFVNHAFWEFALNELITFCKGISLEIFPNSLDVQLRETLSKCLSICCLLDIVKGTIVFNDTFKNEKKRVNLLLKESITKNIKLQTIINNKFGTKLDIEKWAKSDDSKKLYQRCGVVMQKEAMKSGKEFVKLYKIYKIRKHKEKKQKLLEKEAKAKEEKENRDKQEQEKQKKDEAQQDQVINNVTDDDAEIEKENTEKKVTKTETQKEETNKIEANEETNKGAIGAQEQDIKNAENKKDENKEDESKEVESKEWESKYEETENMNTNNSTKSQPQQSSNYLFVMAIVVALIVILLGLILRK